MISMLSLPLLFASGKHKTVLESKKKVNRKKTNMKPGKTRFAKRVSPLASGSFVKPKKATKEKKPRPYKVGERILMDVSCFGLPSGEFVMEIRPLVEVRGHKSYQFHYTIKTNTVFSLFYRVDDKIDTFVDYETLLPYNYDMYVNESKQNHQINTYFFHKKKIGVMWEQKRKRNGSIERKKTQWDIREHSQNVFSVAYHLRTMDLQVGKELRARVAHEGKNIVMRAQVLRREKIKTEAGVFDTFVIQPEFDVDGKFKPTGKNLLWLTADEKRFIVRIQSKIRIASIFAEAKEIVESSL